MCLLQLPRLIDELAPGFVELTAPVFQAFLQHCDFFVQFVTAPLNVVAASLHSTEFVIQLFFHALHNGRL
jgi:hypothetical protein